MSNAETVRLSDDVTIIRGDCRDVLPVECDAVVTDPPYVIEMRGGGIGAERVYTSKIRGFTDGGFDTDILSGFDNWTVFCGIRQLREMLELASVRRWMLITWNKPNPTPLSNGNYLPDTEYIVHSFPSGGLRGEYRDRARFIVYPARQGNPHPNQKPLPIMVKCVKCATSEGATVLDPYMGSGTTGIACIRTGRKFIGIEKDPRYFDMARARLERELAQGRLALEYPA